MRFRSASACIVALIAPLAGAPAYAQPAPFMEPIAGAVASTPAAIATQNVLDLNSAMLELYGSAGRVFQRNIRANHPIILGMFSTGGGRFILYRPGQPPLEAPSVPVVYQVMKSVGHSTMALAEAVAPYLDNPVNQEWRAALLAYRSRVQSAIDTLDRVEMPGGQRATVKAILIADVVFMDQCVERRAITTSDLQAFATREAPDLKKVVAWAAETQVAHWMDVLAGWKSTLGPDWNKAYAMSNSIYVTRQNNVLFGILAQFFPPEAINARLMLLETTSFTTTPDEMLESLTRIVADRSVGALFFKNYYLMDYELMGGDARVAISAETARRGMTTFLPPVVPFGSNQWPALSTAGPGAATLADLP